MVNLSKRCFVHIFCVTMLIMIWLMPFTTAKESLSLPPSLPALEDKDEQKYQLQPSFRADYSIWNPTPICGGGYAAPVPHRL